MKTKANIIGVYPVDAHEDVYLVEMFVRDSKQKINPSEFTQELQGQSEEYWQVPWDERVIDETGKEVIADDFIAREISNGWIGDIHLIFFFHYIDFSKPLITPFGLLKLPQVSERPVHLSQIKYESPD